jgi:hypothetical protein
MEAFDAMEDSVDSDYGAALDLQADAIDASVRAVAAVLSDDDDVADERDRFNYALLGAARDAGLFDTSERHQGRGDMWDDVVARMTAWLVSVVSLVKDALANWHGRVS